jgi:hypothetical protein
LTFLHCGLNKAGSTALQAALEAHFAPGRHRLYVYPPPFAPGGNAIGIAHWLARLDRRQVNKCLTRLASHCKRGARLLLSTESLYHQLVREAQHEMFLKCIADVGLDDLTLTIVYRNVYEHSVSAYCHRAGAHDLPPFARWIGGVPASDGSLGLHGYEFWIEAKGFIDLLAPSRLSVITIPYSPNVVTAVSDAWRIQMKPSSDQQRANVTVPPHDAEFLKLIRHIDHSLALRTRDELKKLRRSKCGESDPVRLHYTACIQQEICIRRPLLDRLERSLGFRISDPPAGVTNLPHYRGYQLGTSSAEYQLRALVEASARGFRQRTLLSKIGRQLARVRAMGR